MKTIDEQYNDIKKQYPNALLLFRCGDFYEAYHEDADKASKILNITLTRRDGIDGMHMCGFPYHALDSYLPKLVRAGLQVAICDRLDEPKPATKRSVTELVTPVAPTAGQLQEETPVKEPKQALLPKGLTKKTADKLQLSLFDEQPSDYLLHFRDEVAKELLVQNYKQGIQPDFAAQLANSLVRRLYGIDLKMVE